MSTLRVSTIQDTAGSNSSTPSAIANGIAKAWVNFFGGTPVSIRADFNVTSITDNGAGDFTVNFTTALADANYSAVVTAGGGGTAAVGNALVGWGAVFAAGSLRIGVSDNNTDTNSDPAIVCVAIFR